LLIAAVIAVVAKVLLPQPGFTVDIAEIKQYPTFAYISRERVRVQGGLMLGLVKALRGMTERA
jgi:hypothetical protein